MLKSAREIVENDPSSASHAADEPVQTWPKPSSEAGGDQSAGCGYPSRFAIMRNSAARHVRIAWLATRGNDRRNRIIYRCAEAANKFTASPVPAVLPRGIGVQVRKLISCLLGRRIGHYFGRYRTNAANHSRRDHGHEPMAARLPRRLCSRKARRRRGHEAGEAVRDMACQQ
jgi:hypothetical protein